MASELYIDTVKTHKTHANKILWRHKLPAWAVVKHPEPERCSRITLRNRIQIEDLFSSISTSLGDAS